MGEPDHADVVDVARRIYACRRRRSRFLPGAIFGEPAWDMLLDLLVSAAEERAVSVSSACLASGAPATTAMRHLRALERAGLVERRRDAKDMRRSFLSLTPTGELRVRDAILDTIGLFEFAP